MRGNTVYVGVDPGLTGAVAILTPTQPPVVHDMPVLQSGKKRVLNEAVLRSLFETLGQQRAQSRMVDMHVIMEKVHSMPKQGVASSFTFGEGYGLLRGMIVMARLPYTLVTPQRWKKAMLDGMPKEKSASLVRAQALFPLADLHLKKHHGRADALLMAEYGRLYLGDA